MRLAVSPIAASTLTGVFNQWFEALFPGAGALGCEACFAPPQFLPVYLCANVWLRGLLAVALPAPFHNPPPRWVHQPPPCRESSPPQLPISAPPTGLDECFFFISLVVRLPYSLIFGQFWLFFCFYIVFVLLFVVQGGTVCLPTPPSWLEAPSRCCILKYNYVVI